MFFHHLIVKASKSCQVIKYFKSSTLNIIMNFSCYFLKVNFLRFAKCLRISSWAYTLRLLLKKDCCSDSDRKEERESD